MIDLEKTKLFGLYTHIHIYTYMYIYQEEISIEESASPPKSMQTFSPKYHPEWLEFLNIKSF